MSSWMRKGRSRARTANGRKSGGSRKKRCFGFRDEIKLTRKPKNLLFVPGEYESYRGEVFPYWTWLRHKFVDPNKAITRKDSSGAEYQRDFMATYYCTRAGTPNWSGECASCDKNNPRMDPDDRDKRIGTSSVQHWTVIDLDWYYKVTNKWGDTVYTQPESPAEEKRFLSEGYEKVFGKKGYLAFGPLHSTQFDEVILKTVERMCGGCEYDLGEEHKYSGALEPAKFLCGECGEVVEDLATTEWTGNMIEEASFGQVDIQCPSCGAVGEAQIEWGCNSCSMPTEVDLWDCVIPLSKFVSKTENGKTQSSIQMPVRGRILFATDYMLPNGEALARTSDAGDLEFNPLVSSNYSPIDFKGDLFKTQFDPEYQLNITDGALSGGVTPRRKDN